jgi:hypothetical protein
MSARNRPARPGLVNNISVGPMSQGSARFPLTSQPLGRGTALSTADADIHKLSQGVMEEIYLWCANVSASDVILKLNFNGQSTGTATTTVQTSIASRAGLVLVWPGIPHASEFGNNDTSFANFIKASAASNSALILYGFVVRHYPRDRDNLDIAGYHYGAASE